MEGQQKIWFITGTSSGFGKRLVALALSRGDRVIATVRRLADFNLTDVDRSRLLIIELDVTSSEDIIQKKADDAIAHWGRIDILVNNAGNAPLCLLEEGGLKTAYAQFETNFFGLVKVTSAIVPHMRERKSGLVVCMGSRSVWKADTKLLGYYSASKSAVHAYTEALATELSEFGVRVLLVAPGAFRTENIHHTPYTQNKHIPAYDETRQAQMAGLMKIWDRAKGNPDKAMEVVVDVIRGEGTAAGRELPFLLVLGNATHVHARAYCQKLTQILDDWEDITKDLDYRDGE